MNLSEYVLIGIGTAISVIGYFLKRENRKLDALEKKVGDINVTLAKNDVRDKERWEQTNKRLEDRRVDIRKLYDLVQEK